MLRFERANRRLQSPSRPGLAEVAAACGYYGEAHMTREWRVPAGRTPRAWLEEQLPFVPDGGARPAA